MEILIKLLIGLVAFIHLFIFWFEMFSWETTGKKVFGGALKSELFPETKTMAANQGLYNGFLVAGLVWTFFIDNIEWSENIALFFLSCVSVAGIYATITVSKTIFFIQALPALIVITLILI